MFEIKKELTGECWKGGNTKRLLVVHHTGSRKATTFQNIINFFKKRDYISIHYVVGYKGEITQLVAEDDRAWHAGKSAWDGLVNLNHHSIGIEVLSDGEHFTETQRKAVQWLSRNIIERNTISIDNVVRHSDIAPGRKMDIGKNFYEPKWGSWKRFQESLVTKVPESDKDKRKRLEEEWEEASHNINNALKQLNEKTRELALFKNVLFKKFKISQG